MHQQQTSGIKSTLQFETVKISKYSCWPLLFQTTASWYTVRRTSYPVRSDYSNSSWLLSLLGRRSQCQPVGGPALCTVFIRSFIHSYLTIYINLIGFICRFFKAQKWDALPPFHGVHAIGLYITLYRSICQLLSLIFGVQTTVMLFITLHFT